MKNTTKAIIAVLVLVLALPVGSNNYDDGYPDNAPYPDIAPYPDEDPYYDADDSDDSALPDSVPDSVWEYIMRTYYPDPEQ